MYTTLFSIDKSPNQYQSAGTLLPRSEKATSVESAVSPQVTRLQSSGSHWSLVCAHFLPAVTTNKKLSPRAYPRRGLGPQDRYRVSWDSTNQWLPRKKSPQLLLGIHGRLGRPATAPSKSAAGGQFSAPPCLSLG